MSRLALGPGLLYVPDYLDRGQQEHLRDELAAVEREAPFFTPTMPRSGKPFSVRMTNCGTLGWVSDVAGYRYEGRHPMTGQAWPAMPEVLLRTWDELSGYPHPPEAALVNRYAAGTRMGLHRDEDEAALDAPVVSLSLGDAALFRIGGLGRRDPTRSLRLRSGDAFVFGGPARLVFHGIDRVDAGTSDLLPEGGRINITLRRVTAPERSAT